jgi:hypothetical protein
MTRLCVSSHRRTGVEDHTADRRSLSRPVCLASPQLHGAPARRGRGEGHAPPRRVHCLGNQLKDHKTHIYLHVLNGHINGVCTEQEKAGLPDQQPVNPGGGLAGNGC